MNEQKELSAKALGFVLQAERHVTKVVTNLQMAKLKLDKIPGYAREKGKVGRLLEVALEMQGDLIDLK